MRIQLLQRNLLYHIIACATIVCGFAFAFISNRCRCCLKKEKKKGNQIKTMQPQNPITTYIVQNRNMFRLLVFENKNLYENTFLLLFNFVQKCWIFLKKNTFENFKIKTCLKASCRKILPYYNSLYAIYIKTYHKGDPQTSLDSDL